MKAWQVREHGTAVFVPDAPELELASADADGVVIEVEAAAANYADNLLIDGSYQERPALPFTPGMEVAGVVTESNSATLAAGDRVVGLCRFGVGPWAERAVADAAMLSKLPDPVSAIDAVGFYVNAQTSHLALHHRARVTPDDTVLVHAAAGGVGSMAVQLAVAAGCRVFATTSAAKRHIPIRLGATECFDNRDPAWVEQVKAATGGRGVDIVIDPVGGPVFDKSIRALAFEGRLVTVGFASGDVPLAKTNHLLVKNVSLIGFYWANYTTSRPELVRAASTELFDLHQAGRLDPMVTRVEPMEQALAAVRDIAAGNSSGKVVLVWDR